MRKYLSLILLFFIFVSTAFSVDIVVGGNKLSMDVPPQIVEGRTMVPIAVIGQSLDAHSEWSGDTKTVTIVRGNHTISLQIGNPTATVNNEITTLDVPAQIVNGRTMVPVSFIARAFGENVEWNGTTRTVHISKASSISSSEPEKYLVTRVIDGDTIEINYKGKTEKVRLIGIDTPESVHPDAEKNVAFGKTASEFTRKALENKEVTLEFDVSERDRYGRLLAYIWIDGKMFNRTLVESGMAMAYTYPPDVKYSKEFSQLQEQARNNKAGVWADYFIETATPAPSTTGNTSTEIDADKNGKLIKGNKNSMIYHVPQGRDYDKVATHNIVWFETEEDAQKAGYRRAKQ